MTEDDKRTQRLYLARGDNEVYIDTTVLPQHQIDAVRFLYQQFVKKKPGVVLNDPDNHGKRIQTVLFISAIRPQLKLPILILCPEGKEQTWSNLFHKWTEMGSELSIQAGNRVTLNPLCHICSFLHLKAVEHRQWSILAVEEHHVAFKILDSKLKAEYKIWIASINMKIRLPTFAFIYMWLYPKERFYEDFEGNVNSPTALYKKSVRLDAFMEDIVIRRQGVEHEKREEMGHPSPVTRKNKDATGKKIKRSKQSLEDKTKNNTEVNVTTQASKHGDKRKYGSADDDFKVFAETNAQSKMDIESSDKEIASNVAINNNNYSNQVKNKSNKDDVKDKDESNEVDIDIKMAENSQDTKTDSKTNSDNLDDSYNLLKSCDVNSQNITIKYDSDSAEVGDEIKTDHNHKTDNEINNKINLIESEDIFSSDILSTDIKSDSKVINHDISITSNEIDETACKNIEILSEDILSENLPSKEVKNEVVVKTDDINRNKNEIVNKNNISENNKTEEKLEGVELKMKQMEELAMKKFKGSFLDRMF